jgi:hypothetical protein
MQIRVTDAKIEDFHRHIIGPEVATLEMKGARALSLDWAA